MGKSTGLKAQEEMFNKQAAKDQDQKSLTFYIDQLNDARDQRMQPRQEFDDMTYEQDYGMNQLVGHSYLRRKKNDDEIRVNTGTAEKKVELMLNELSAMNFQAEVRAFDDDDLEAKGIGEDMADVMKRTNEIERDEDTWEEAYIELLTQRALFMEELYAPLPTAMVRTGKQSQFRSRNFAQKRVLSGLQVFLGDITMPAIKFQEQPFVVKYERVLYETAAEMADPVTGKLFKDLPNWKYVRPGMPLTDSYGQYFKYRLGTLKSREVEIITYMSAADNEMQVILNSVMMHKPGTPLPWKHTGYNMTMIVVKSISRFFAYGKQPMASAKFLQGLSDETFRSAIRKMRQATDPPSGVKSGKVYSKDIWSPGAMTQGISAGDIESLIKHDGVTSSDLEMMQLISTKIDEFVGPYGVQQNPGAGTPTATQIIEQQKQSLKMLGRAMLAAMRAKREMSYLRLWTLYEKYFEPVGNGKDGKKYRMFTIPDAELGDGKTGKKIIAFSGSDLTKEQKDGVLKMEDESDKKGEPMRYRQPNVEKLKDIPLTWYITVNSRERESGALDRVLFQDQMTQAASIMQVTGRTIKADKLIDDFERTWKVKGLFERDTPAPMMGGGSVEDKAQGMLAELGKMQTPAAQQLTPKTQGIPGTQPGAKTLAMA